MPSSNKEDVTAYAPQDISSEKSVKRTGGVFEKNNFFLNNSEFEIDPQVATHMGLFEARTKEEKRVFDAEVFKFVQKIKDDAYNEAYKLGQEQGIAVARQEALDQAKTEITDQLKNLVTIIQALDKYRQRMYVQNEAEIVRFSFYVAEKIVLNEVKMNKDSVVAIVKKMIPEEQSCVVCLSPKDIDFIHEHMDMIGKDIDLTLIKFERDENLKEGDVILETPNGTLDGTLNSRLEKLKNALEQLE